MLTSRFLVVLLATLSAGADAFERDGLHSGMPIEEAAKVLARAGYELSRSPGIKSDQAMLFIKKTAGRHVWFAHLLPSQKMVQLGQRRRQCFANFSPGSKS